MWNYIITAVGLAGFYLAGKKVWWCWYVNIFNQILWFTYGVITEQWGFVLGTFFYTFVFVKNAISWTKEHIATLPPVTPQARFCPLWFHERFHEGPASTSMKYMSLGFNLKIDTSQFEAGMKKAASQLSKIKLTDATAAPGWYDAKPEWRTRYFGWISHWRNIGSHWNKTCSCYLRKNPVIGRIKSIEERDGGLHVTSQIDTSTPEGKAAWEKIQGPPGSYSIAGCNAVADWQGRHISCEVSEHPADFPHEAVLMDAMPPLRVKWDRFGHTTAEEISHAGSQTLSGYPNPNRGSDGEQRDRRPADC
jgi:hypothetical protein